MTERFSLFMTRLFVLIALLCLMVNPGAALPVDAQAFTIRYVAATGTDSGNCGNEQSPCRSIQYAVNRSASGDVILVAKGTYTYNPAADTCPFLQTRAVVCFVDKRLTILGGYAVDNWYLPNPGDNPTIIDGSNAYRGVAAIGYNTTTSYLEMAGFTIQNARAQGPTYLNPYDPSGVGGGMLVQHASVTLRDVIFRNNRAIGANTSAGAGGQADGAGLRLEQPPAGTTSLLQRVVFENNISTGGSGPERGGIAFGALFSYKANLVIEDSQFVNNLAQAGSTSNGRGESANGSRADALGGGIAIMDSIVTIRRVEVTDNQVIGGNGRDIGGGGYGGGIFIEDPVIPRDQQPVTVVVTITDSFVARNRAVAGNGAQGGNGAGGGIDVDSSTVTIDRTQIIQNSVTGGSGNSAGPGAGGGVYIFAVQSGSFPATLRNVVVANNFADQGSGAGNSGNGGGGGIVIHGINADITHTTIAGNRIGSALVLGQGLLVQPWPNPTTVQFPAAVRLSNSVIANHTGNTAGAAVVVQRNSSLTFDRGLFSGNSKNTNDDGLPVVKGSINGLTTMETSANAGFVAPQEPYFNYRLREDSFARNKTANISINYDFDQQARPQGNTADYGADEYHPFVPVFRQANASLYFDWTNGIDLFSGGVSRYGVVVHCESGASPPNGAACGQEINTGSNSSITLAGLTNFKFYTIVVNAYNSNGQRVASSSQIRTFPTNIFVFIPSVFR